MSMTNNKMLLDAMFPEHERINCSDDNPINGMDFGEGWTLAHKCKRCSVLQFMQQNLEQESNCGSN